MAAAPSYVRAVHRSARASFAKCSNDTALRDIRELLARGVIVRNPAGGRSTSYRLQLPGEQPDLQANAERGTFD